MHAERTLNLLGAAAQLCIDRQTDSILSLTGLNATAAAALVTVGHAPGESIDFLRQALSRSHSATVRLVADLEARGLFERLELDDARAVGLRLTARGERQLEKVHSARMDALGACLNGFSSSEMSRLDVLLGRLLGSNVAVEQDAYQVCRLCNGEACDPCPVEEAMSDPA
jgi:DNA-binding MarR family transcriptional regulator